jgi:ATP-binding cassette, subfamily B, bacterial
VTTTEPATPEREGETRSFTFEDVLRPPDRGKQLRRTPRLALDALRLVWDASPRHLLIMLALQVLTGAGVGAQLLVAREVMQELIAVSHGASVSGLYTPLVLFAVVSVLIAGLTAVATHQQQLLVELVARFAFDRIVAVGSSVDYRLLETPEFYNQLQRARTSGDFRIIDMVSSVSQLLGAVLTTAAIAAVLLLLSPLLLAFVLLAAVPLLLAAVVNSRESYAFEYAMTAESRERAYVVGLMTSREAAKEVRLLGLGPHLRRRYEVLSDERLRQFRRFLLKRLRVAWLGGLAGALGMAVALGALVVLLRGGHIGVAAAVTAALAMQQLAGRLKTIISAVARLIESGMFIEDYQAFIELAPEAIARVADQAGSVREPPARGAAFDHVSLEDVCFRYPGAPADTLQGVSLEVRPGEVVALVGGNGSGKTTLVKLICALYRPDRGRVKWNGIDAATLPFPAIASDITVLFQDYLQYHVSALDNVTFGRIEKPAHLEDAIVAAKQAGAHDFLEALPHGYRTRMGLEFDGGAELSVGQWQRLALARAFFREGSFLVLDEPTAALDPRAEADLFAQMRLLSEGCSVLLISHRYSSARSADRIYVLDEGRIVESGSHGELMALNGHYAALFNLQAAAYLGEDPA